MGESKQVKVDNWGIFFLQRLQTFFNKTYFCDLTLQFEDNVQLKVHRLVMNACTEYFQVLEQTCEVINDCLIMPPDLQADVVVPIVNFMYTGILEFQTSIFDRLYSTARLMNMTVLTKLLDAQKVPISPIPKPINKRTPISPITWNLQGKKISPRTMDPDLPEPLPGRKLPIWKRKSVPSTIAYRNDIITSLPDPLSTKYFRSSIDEAPKPTRFEWPEDEDTNFDTNSFDEISYTSKPIILPQREKSPKPSTSSNNFEELKRSIVAVKRPASPIYNDNKKVNIQDVKEYIKEQKLRSDYIDYDDSEAADNDLQTYENDNDTDDDTNKDDVFDQNQEDTPNKSILKNDTSTTPNKRVRFSLEGKENAAKTPQKLTSSAASIKTNATSVDMTNHTKIITEVLKKYPHLVKKNKNIRLKILAKGANATTGIKPLGTPVKMVKSTAKVSYMVMKPGEGTTKSATTDSKKDGHWSCHKCSNPNPLQFETYYLYRKHLTEVHNEKTDSQMCNICGHISRKQNMLMYHKFIKHNITPPPSYLFPKCKDCPYIALSPALLTKHQIIHTHQNLVCAECNTTFQTKSALISHVQLTGHTDKNNCPTYDCGYCTKKFISDETLFQHIKNNHKIEARRDNIISEADEEDEAKKEVITAEEIDALEEQQEPVQQQIVPEKPKEKIKILSDVKVTTSIKRKMQPVKLITAEPQPQGETTQDVDSQPLEPSSEAESLSNVASGIAASLGLVNTIVVLDENQFILQSQDGNQENMIAGNSQNIILPDVSNINNIQNLVSQHQVITTDNNTIISQAALNKNNIASTDELVMVLTDHDYSDASNNAVITSENSNIVVLYSHPVQSQDGQFISQPGNLVLNSDMGLVEVSNNYAVANTIAIDEKQCEESIEMIQQEINNHLEGEHQEIQQQVKIKEEQVTAYDEVKSDIIQEQEPDTNVEIPKESLADPNPEPEQMEVDPVDHQITKRQQEMLELTKENDVTTESKLLVPSQEETEVLPTLYKTAQSDCEVRQNPPPENVSDNNFEEPMEIEESMEMIHQEIHKNTAELLEIVPEKNSEITPEENSETFVEDIPPIVEQQKVQTESAVEKELPVTHIDTEQEQQVQEHNEQAEERTEIAINGKETKENDVTKKNQEIINKNQPEEEVERMEVDSAKPIENSVEPESQIENVESTINGNENQSESIEKPKLISDEVIPDSEEEKCENTKKVNVKPEEMTKPQIEPENILQPEEKKLSQNNIKSVEDNTQSINKETKGNVENERENTTEKLQTEIEPNVKSEVNTGEKTKETLPKTIESTTEEIKEKTVEENNDTSVPGIEEPQEAEISEEVETNKQLSSPEQPNQETKESNIVATEPSVTNNKESLTMTNSKISNLLDDWDDGDTDSQQSDTSKPNPVTDNRSSINTLINDWEDEEET